MRADGDAGGLRDADAERTAGRRALPLGRVLRASQHSKKKRSRDYFFGGTIASLHALATRNFTTVLAGI